MSTGHLITMLYVHVILLLLNTFELLIGGANVSSVLYNKKYEIRILRKVLRLIMSFQLQQCKSR